METKETKTKQGVPYKRGTGYVYYLGIRDDSGRKKTWFSRVFKTYEEALADSTERQKYLKQIQAKTSPNEKLKNYLDVKRRTLKNVLCAAGPTGLSKARMFFARGLWLFVRKRGCRSFAFMISGTPLPLT